MQKANPTLDDYATGKGTDSLLVMVAEEEKNIRQRPGASSAGMLPKGFGARK